MANRVSRPNAYGLRTASGTAASTANIRSSAPRMRSSLFHMIRGLPSDLADDRLAEDPGGAHGEGDDEEEQPRNLAPAAAELIAGDAFQRAEEHADEHHAETGLEPGDDRDRKGLEDERRGHRR